jgi:hypothetical protein
MKIFHSICYLSFAYFTQMFCKFLDPVCAVSLSFESHSAPCIIKNLFELRDFSSAEKPVKVLSLT